MQNRSSKVKRVARQALLYMIFTAGILPVASAQDEEASEGKWFKKENLFTGGTLNLGFGNQITALGVNPHFGYSFNKYLDAAFSMNVNYISQRDYPFIGDKIKQTVLGPGVFVRVYPVKFLFAQALFERSYIKVKYIPGPNSGYVDEKYNLKSNNLLVGAGYATGREGGSNSFFYFSILWDVTRDINSPYLDQYRRSIPQIRSGVNIALFQGGSRRKMDD